MVRQDINQGKVTRPFALDIDPAKLPNRQELKRRIALHEANLKQMAETGKNKRTFTDPECSAMRMHDGASRPACNIQTATDINHLITEFEVTNEGSNIRVEVQGQSKTSCFSRHADGRVTCPMGKGLFFRTERKYGKGYSSREACRTCPNRCTDSRQVKVIRFGEDTHYVPVVMYENPRYPLQQIPDIEQNTPYHRFGRVVRQKARVMVFIRRDKAKQKLRMQVSEHPFGTVKLYHGAYHFLCRGKEKVGAELALSFLAYNMIRAVNLVSVPGILAHLYRKNKGNRAKTGMI